MKEIYRSEINGHSVCVVGDGHSYCFFDRRTGQSATLNFGVHTGVTAAVVLAAVSDHLRACESPEPSPVVDSPGSGSAETTAKEVSTENRIG